MGSFGWDETVYLFHGQALAGLRPFTYFALDLRPPLLPVILAGLFTVVNSVLAAHVLIALLSSAVLALTYILGRRLFSRWIGVVGAAIVALSPKHVEMSHEILVDAWLPLWWLATAICVDIMLRTDDRRRARFAAVGTGISIGLGILTKFTSIALVGALGISLFAYHLNEGESLINSFVTTLRRPTTWIVPLAALVTLSPYLAWSAIETGSPIGTFLNGFRASGSPEPFDFYIAHYQDLLGAIFVAAVPVGAVLGDWGDRRTRWGVGVLIVFSAVLLLPLQFVVTNREVRYLLPALPFLALLSARAFVELGSMVNRRSVATAVVIVLILSAIPLYQGEHLNAAVHGNLTRDPADPETQAVKYIKANSESGTRIYLNSDWPRVAYYSHRPFKHPRSFNLNTDTFSRPGYIYYTERMDSDPETLQALKESPRTTDHRVFGGYVHVFQLHGRNSTDKQAIQLTSPSAQVI
jgi:hypothetical protein